MPNPFYNTLEWHKLRSQVKARWKRLGLGCALCRMPLDWIGKNAVHVDHIKPRSTHPELALQIRNCQCLCALCHNSEKKRIEAGTQKPAIGTDGWPVG